MVKNFLKIAWRNITRNKAHTIINVLGLALGITCCLFIFLWVQDEKSIDNFHQQGKNLYTAYQTTTVNGQKESSYTTPILQGNQQPPVFVLEDVKGTVPEVKSVVFYATGYELPWGHSETFQVGDKILKLEGARASEDFFKIFSYPLVAGNPQTALKQMNGIAISRKMAEMFFGSAAGAMGKTMRYENRLDFVVTAVFENLTAHSSLKFDFLLNWEAHKKLLEWASPNFRTFLLLSETANVHQTATRLDRFVQARLDTTKGAKTTIGLQPVRDQYLYSHFEEGRPAGGRIEYIRIFSAIALFILVIACINFMNLATARSVTRAKEIGLRKVVGSTRAHLIGQFLGESLAFALLATLVSLALLLLLLPSFNAFTGKNISLPLDQLSCWISLLGIMLFTGLVAGSYPALYLSALKPVSTLKGVVRFTWTSLFLRKGLTVFQFVLSILLLIATMVTSQQTSYVQNTHLGYNRENLVYIRIEGELAKQSNYLLFKNRVSAMPGIAMVDRSSEAPHAMGFVVTTPVNWEGKDPNAAVGFKPASVGFDFIKLMKLKIAEGRDFNRAIATDSADAFMVNEEAVRQMGMKDPIGKWVSAWKKKGHIIAVLKDYHTHSLHEPIKPVILDVKEYEYFGVIIVRTQPGKTKEALASLAKVYKEINPQYAFAWQFIDQEYKSLYNSELIVSKLSVVFAVLAILISCLGLLGLVRFSAEQRTKEIGIRKVLGASISRIIVLFSKDFLQLVLLAFLIAAPLAWYVMQVWLQDFAYRIDISWWIFLSSGSIAVMTALLTVGYQAFKAAVANPLKNLRSE